MKFVLKRVGQYWTGTRGVGHYSGYGFPMSAKLCRHTAGSVEKGTGWCWRVSGDVRGACGGDSVKRRVDRPSAGTSP